MRNASGADLLLTAARFEIGKLEPGAEKTVEFTFRTRDRLQQEAAVVEMTVYDSVLGESVSEKLKYPVYKRSAGPAKARGAFRTASATTIHEGASKRSGVIASATKGVALPIAGKLGEWFRLDLGQGRPGFAHQSGGRVVSHRSRLSGLQTRWQVTPPKLAVHVPSYETSSDHYKLFGVATDDGQVEGRVSFSSPTAMPKSTIAKFFYQSNRGANQRRQLEFAADLPLWPGAKRHHRGRARK